jgi:hypothetical protein
MKITWQVRAGVSERAVAVLVQERRVVVRRDRVGDLHARQGRGAQVRYEPA